MVLVKIIVKHEAVQYEIVNSEEGSTGLEKPMLESKQNINSPEN